ncbi:MAG: hypothetical protein WDN23_20870 [Edaphobacter sp.]
MTNVIYGLQDVAANTSGELPTSPSVPTHVGGHTVRIDAIALKNLIDKLKTAFGSKVRP